MQCQLTRRRFLQAAAIGITSISSNVLSASARQIVRTSPLRIGIVGICGRGEILLQRMTQAGAAIVALCDVDEIRSAPIRSRYEKAKFYIDFRELVTQKGLDAVVVATPDHTHATATLAALNAGLHVYCEKPLTHDVYEARAIAKTAAKKQRVTQMGTQLHSTQNFSQVVELIQSNYIGAVHEVHVWSSKPLPGNSVDARPKRSQPVPMGLHWDLWLGPAPYRPFYRGTPDKEGHFLYEPTNWERWWDFGGGTLGDMGCHFIDLPFSALQLRSPIRVSAEGSPPHPETVPEWLIVTYEFPARGNLPPVKLMWYDGGKYPKILDEGSIPHWHDGVLFVGEKGMLITNFQEHRLLHSGQSNDDLPPKTFSYSGVNHFKEWVDACQGHGTASCDFEYADMLTETVLLGNVAYRLGKTLEWDARNLKATNAPEAEKFLWRKYREPWSLSAA